MFLSPAPVTSSWNFVFWITKFSCEDGPLVVAIDVFGSLCAYSLPIEGVLLALCERIGSAVRSSEVLLLRRRRLCLLEGAVYTYHW